MKLKSIVLTLALGFSSSAFAKVPVSILTFKNNVGSISCDQDWYWWSDNLGSAFKDMLITELSGLSTVEVLERENIQELNDSEVNLVNSDQSSHKIKKGQFTKAKYTFVGSVSEYEYCADKKKASIGIGTLASVMGLGDAAETVANVVDDISVSKAHAKVRIDLRVIDTQTGRILKSVKTEGSVERSNFKLDSRIVSIQEAKNTPVAEAAREAIAKAVKQLNPVLM